MLLIMWKKETVRIMLLSSLVYPLKEFVNGWNKKISLDKSVLDPGSKLEHSKKITWRQNIVIFFNPCMNGWKICGKKSFALHPEC